MPANDAFVRRAIKAFVPRYFHPSQVYTRAVRKRTGVCVAAGPFEGMRYGDESIESAYLPKLLGTYEQELHGVVESICRRKPPCLVNIGGGEGYYAVGLARRLPECEVIVFEALGEGRDKIKELAALNGVADQIDVRPHCDPEALRGVLEPRAEAIIVCDVEGDEATLLDPEQVAELACTSILVEVHYGRRPGMGDLITSRFQGTHRITCFDVVPRRRSDYRYRDWRSRLLPSWIAIMPVCEYRTESTGWFWMEARDNQAPTG